MGIYTKSLYINVPKSVPIPIYIPSPIINAQSDRELIHIWIADESRTTQWVFVSGTGKQMERSVVHRMIKKTYKRVGVDKRASSHWLRHSHAAL